MHWEFQAEIKAYRIRAAIRSRRFRDHNPRAPDGISRCPRVARVRILDPRIPSSLVDPFPPLAGVFCQAPPPARGPSGRKAESRVTWQSPIGSQQSHLIQLGAAWSPVAAPLGEMKPPGIRGPSHIYEFGLTAKGLRGLTY